MAKVLTVFLWGLIFSLPVMQVKDNFHVWFERSGGFAGMTIKTEIDSKSTDPVEADSIRHLVNQSNFFEVQITDTLPAGLPDQFNYKIKVESGNKSREIELTDSTIPVDFHPLIRYLVQKARSK